MLVGAAILHHGYETNIDNIRNEEDSPGYGGELHRVIKFSVRMYETFFPSKQQQCKVIFFSLLLKNHTCMYMHRLNMRVCY